MAKNLTQGQRFCQFKKMNKSQTSYRCFLFLLIPVIFVTGTPGWAAAREDGLSSETHGQGLERPDSSAGTGMNVLFVVVDDLNNDLGCYGHNLVLSPHIDSLSDRGLRFDQAYCQYPVCNPSRSSFMTGLYPEQTDVLSNGGNFRNRLPDTPTLAQHFKYNGYFTARVGKVFHYGVPGQIGTSGKDDPQSWNETVNPIGIDKRVEPDIHSLQPGQFGGTLSWLQVDSTDLEHTDGQGASACIRLLEEHHPDRTGKPFFLAMGFYRPHTPFVAPTHYFEKYPQNRIHPVMEKAGDRDDIPPAALHDRPGQRELTLAQRREIIQAYYACITFMDAQVGRLLAALDRLKLRDRTIIVFFSDHGYHLGAHGLWQKSDLFEGSARVPLIIVDPRRKGHPAGTSSLAELVDLYPTLVELCGLPKPAHLEGKSLTPILDNPAASVRDSALTLTVSRGRRMHRDQLPDRRILGHSIRTQRYRYTEWGGGEFGTELYDYAEDPAEYTNLARQPGHENLLRQLSRMLSQRMAETR